MYRITAVIGLLLLTVSNAEAENALVLDPVTVNADLREVSQYEIPASVTVLNTEDLQNRGATHFEDVIQELPNVNFSGQSSRPRHIQIRGIGERDEYTGRPNSSVGFAIDDIDFSGIGMVGNLFDVKQVEVLRGPQGTRYGANALAGLINVVTAEATPWRENMLELTAGDYGLTEIGLMTSGAFKEGEDDSPLYRFSLFKHDSDGYYKNAYLGKNDTNGRDELSLRGKLQFTPNDDTRIDLTLMHANLDNGYDAWSLDNSFTTLSDQPGKDTQQSTAAAVKVHWDGSANFAVVSTTTIADSKMQFAYDGDWVYPGYHPNGDNTYAYNNDKNRDTISQELRLVSNDKSRLFNATTDWLLGFYGLRLNEDNHTTDNFGANLISDYRNTRLAVFAQLDYQHSESQVVSAGLRIENHDLRYVDNNGENFSPDETLWGGHLSFTQRLSAQHSAYASVSRGYKGGGFNTGLSSGADPILLRYKQETALNYEIGVKSFSLNHALTTSISLFYMQRDNPQFNGYTFVGNNYVYFTENFDKATNYGLEAEFNWQANEQWSVFGSLGLLNTNVSGTPVSATFQVENREQAHAPNYQYLLGAQYRSENGLFVRFSATGLDAFYFSNSHSQKSTAYSLLNARIGYEAKQWEVYLWVRNLLDEEYATRGFFFANEPTFSIEEEYIRLGAPRHFGATIRLRF
ncbi:MAG: TonB-dependent receptor [Xanthomonadales bacterium]|nr:TonB-dependent receptor [Xanthomonadales bacterium]